MGIIHSRAAKKNNKAQAKLANQEAKTVKAERKAAKRGGGEVTVERQSAPAAPARTVEEIRAAGKTQREEIRVAAAERREERLTRQEADRPDAWYKEPTLGGLLSRRHRKTEDES